MGQMHWLTQVRTHFTRRPGNVGDTMVGLTNDDIDKMRNFADTPRYARTPEMLTDEAQEHTDEPAVETGE